MQDTGTGQLHAMPEQAHRDLFNTYGDLSKAPPHAIREAFKGVIPPERQGPVFHVGEVVECKGGKFKVVRFTRKGVYLDGVPANTNVG